MFMLLWGSQI